MTTSLTPASLAGMSPTAVSSTAVSSTAAATAESRDAEYARDAAGVRSRPPVGLAFVTFTAVVISLLTLAGAEIFGPLNLPAASASQFGIVATTTFAIAGVLATYRSLVMHNWWAGAIATVLIGPGAAWSWLTFVSGRSGSRLATSLVVIAAGCLAVILLTKGLRLAHWLEVFGGLGSCGLAMVAAMVRLDPSATGSTSPALLAAVSGMICLYGLLVDLEMAEQRSLVELVESRKRVAVEVCRVEELLHDLRSGLLAIEAAIGSFDDELAEPLQAEAARLRRLTLTGARTVDYFDLVDRVQKLVAARHAAGVRVFLRAPEEATAWGEESEVLAIVDNLVSNAERHGWPGQIMIEISETDSGTRLSVSNRGRLPSGDPNNLFHRGVTTHPDGEGLGLARARMLADINGAELRVCPSKTGTITFELNLRSSSSGAVKVP